MSTNYISKLNLLIKKNVIINIKAIKTKIIKTKLKIL